MARPNFLLVVVDCLRADRIFTGAGQAVVPNIRALANSGLSFTAAFSSSGTTTPSFASILTGASPARHGATMRAHHRLNPALKLMPEFFREAGYTTFASVTGPLDPRVGLARGFEQYAFRSAAATLDTVWSIDILDRIRDLPGPWFALVHYWDLHEEICVLPQFASRRFGETTYDRALSGVDAHLGLLLSRVPENTIVCFMGDHGEDLYANPVQEVWKRALMNLHVPDETDPSIRSVESHLLGRQRKLYEQKKPVEGWHTPYSHGFHLYDHLLRVPWIISGPGYAGARAERIDEPVLNDDVLPTILPLFGMTAPDGITGVNRLAESPRAPIRMMYGHDYWHDGGGYLFTAARSREAKIVRVRPGPKSGEEGWTEHYAVGDRERASGVTDATRELLAHLPDPDDFAGTALSPDDEAALRGLLENLGYL